MKQGTTLLLVVLCVSGVAWSRCDSSVSPAEGWRSINSAPRDGTPVELAQTFGVAPWYGAFSWKNGQWLATDGKRGMVGEECVLWRPLKDAAHYTDPTGGAQNSTKYWCDAEHLGYNADRDICVFPGQPLGPNPRLLMKGAKCSKGFNQTKEFGKLRKVSMSKTMDSDSWVITLFDDNGCSLSLWIDGGKMDTTLPIRAIEPY